MRLYTSELVKKYKARTVVNHVSIDVKQGEIVGLLLRKSGKEVQKYDNALFTKAGSYYRKCGRSTGEL